MEVAWTCYPLPPVATRDPDPDPLARGNRLAFHLCLPFGLLPGVSVFVSGILAFWAVRRMATDRARRWAVALGALAILDVVVTVLVALVLLGRIELRSLVKAEPSRIVIGASLEDWGRGVLVRAVRLGCPADLAGLRDGDIIRSVNGSRRLDSAGLATAIETCPEGEELTLEIERDGSTLRVRVAPASFAQEDGPARLERERLDEALSEETLVSTLRGLIFKLPSYVVLALAWLFARGRGRCSAEFAVRALIVLFTWHIAIWFTRNVSARAFGWYTPAASLITALTCTAVLGAAGWIAAWTMRTRLPDGLQLGRSVLSTVGLGAFYVFFLVGRIGFVAYALDSLGATTTYSGDALSAYRGMDLSTVELVAALGAAVVLAPVAEEVVYRGFLLPWFASTLGSGPALAVTSLAFALAHFHYGWFMLGPAFYGLVLGWARLRSGGLLAPILLHAAINGVASFDFVL